MTTTERIEQRLFALQDRGYRDFQAKLMPSVAPERIIGVRTPELRRLAKELAADPETEAFLRDLPHAYYDENNLHGFIISLCRDYETAVREVDALLPLVDNWATCDLLSPRVFAKHKDRLEADVLRWMASDRPFTRRFGIEMVQTHFLDGDFEPEWIHRVVAVTGEEYYVRMMQAWFLATALAKQWDSTVPVLESRRLDPWTHRKTIQKAVESDRISDERKAFLRSLK